MFDWFKRHQRLVFLLLWLGSTTYAIGFCITTFKLTELYRLTQYGARTEGIVTEKVPENHQRIKYSFSVEGKNYNWGGFAGDIGKNFDQISVGQEIPVTYEINNPNNSCMGLPETTFYPNLRLSIFISLFPTIALVILAIKFFDIPKSKNSN